MGAAVDVAAWLAAREPAMRTLLADLVAIDSGTANREGVTAVGRRIAAFLAEHGVPVETVGAGVYGDGLAAATTGHGDGAPVLLMGHLDTVFPDGEATRRPFRIAGERAYGPGVADMKAGLVMNAFVLAAFQASGEPRPVKALFTGDEEVGSPHYRPAIAAAASQAGFAFNAEPARANGNVVVQRRGGTFIRLVVHGRAAHSGVNLRDGINAVAELAHKIVALHALTDFDAGVTVNVGAVSGGQSVNTTAERAEALIDLRFATPSLQATSLGRVEAICAAHTVAGASADLEILGEFLPLEATPATMGLLALYRASAAAFGIAVDGEATGGCADSGVAAAAGAITLCGTGPVGGHAHTADEYIELPTLLTRAQALARTVQSLPAKAGDLQHTASQKGIR